MKSLCDKVIVGSTEIGDEWLYYYLGSHYYNQYYCWLIHKYPQNVDQINKLFSSKVILKCKGDPNIILEQREAELVVNHFLNVISDTHDLSSGLISTENDLNRYDLSDHINVWISIKKTFAIAYYVCMSVQPEFRHYLPTGYFSSLKLSDEGYESVKVNNIETCIFDYMNHVLTNNPDVKRYRESYNSLLLNFNILQKLLIDDLYKPKSDCIIL